MKKEGPVLEHLLRRLSQCPRQFLGKPVIKGQGDVDVIAVISDLMVDLGAQPVRGETATKLLGLHKGNTQSQINRLQLILISAWLLHDEYFLENKHLAARALEFMMQDLDKLADLVGASLFVTDQERQEELVRHCLSGLELRPAGESETQARDRLGALNSVERQRVLQESRFAEERAEAVRKAMAAQAAQEAAAKSSRE